MPWEWPFAWRVLALLAFLLAVSELERVLRGSDAVRLSETVFLVAFGAAGAAFGLLADLCTSTLSPDYFALGKGLGPEPGLQGRALALGLRAGAGAGVAVACVLLAANVVGRRAPRRAARELYRCLPAVVVHAAAAGVCGGCAGVLLPEALLGDWRAVLEPDARRPFLVVWATHAGLYLGGAVGALCVAHRLRVGSRREGSHR